MGTNCTPKHRLDVAEFDRVLVRANEAHAPERRARRARLRETEKEMLSGVRGPERAVLKGLDFSELADLPPGSRQALARALAAGETDFRRATEAAIPDDPGLRRRVREQMETAGRETAAARSVVAARHARIRDDLAAASPEALRATVAGLRPRDAEALHRHLRAGDAAGLARAAAILRTAGMTPEAAAAAVQQMSGRVIEQAARALYMDNVPPEHRAAMGQLTPDALMEVRVAQFTRTPLDDVRIEAILADVKARRPAADLDALRSAITETAATRHGRPRFREALAQKRAFLDLVPFGMKRKVLQTPLIVLPDDAFLSFVHGSGNESAVTLIVGGRPVVLMRAGADPGRLGEEGLHVLQYHDPEFRSRLGGLDEGRIARWDELTVDDQFAAYRGKVEIEIDAQERAIGRLRARAEAALWPGSRQRTLADLAQAEAALKALTGRRDELDDWSADRRNRVALGLEEKPAWLQQPARMFAKGDADDALIHRHLPEARARVRAAYYDLTRRFDDLPRTERKRLLNLLRTMKGAVEMDELVQTLALVNSGSNDPRHAHLQNLAPDAVTDAVRDHLFTRLRGGTVDDRAAALTRRIKARTFDTDKAENTRLQKLFAETIEALRHPLTGDDPEPAELTAARQAMFLALEKFPASTKNAALAEQLQLVSRMLGLEPAEGAGEGALRKHHQVQAMILEGLATNRTLMLAKDAPQASHTAYIDTVRQLLEGGVTDYPLAAQRSVFETLSRAYLAGGDAETLATIAALPRLLAEAEGVDPGRARIALMTTLEFLAHQPVNRYKEVVQKLGPLLLNAVDLRALPAGSTPAPGRISLADYNHYLQQAIKHPKFAASVIRFGSRARSREEAELGGISEQDLGRMSAAKPIATGQESFLDRHAAAPAGQGRGQDVASTREAVADQVMDAASAHTPPLTLTHPEARAIAKRIEVLDQSGLFAVLTGGGKNRDVLVRRFLADLAESGLEALPAAGQDTRTATDILNRRGKRIEDGFRDFVRALASKPGAEADIPGPAPVLEALARRGTFKVGETEISLSEPARIELIMILVRGGSPSSFAALPPAARAEVSAMLDLMVRDYSSRLGSDVSPENIAAIQTSLREMLGEGIVNVERSAKGSMFEHMVEGLLKLAQNPPEGADVPAIFAQVSSETANASAPRAFQSVDQINDKTPRKLDHICRIGEAEDLPAGLKQGDAIGIDSKNGPGAFSPDQFRRYLYEMLQGAQGKPSIFDPSGADQKKLRALMYMADSPENARHAHAEVVKILREILATESGGRLRLGLGDPPVEIDAAVLRDNAEKLNVFFAHIGQAAAGKGGGHQLGPFMIENLGSTVPELIREVLGPPAVVDREDAAKTPER